MVTGSRRGCVAALVLALLVACTSPPPLDEGSAGPDASSTLNDQHGPARRGSEAEADVVINLAARAQVIDGFGVSARMWEDPHVAEAPNPQVPPAAQEEILDALVGDLGLTRFRSVLEPGMEPVNDNGDPLALDTSALDYSGKRADGQIDLQRQAAGRGLLTSFAAPTRLEPWMTDDEPEEYVEWALAMLLRWRDRGIEPPYFSPINEPATERAGKRSAAWLVEVVTRLGERMREAGLETRLVVPDDLNPEEAYDRAVAVLEDPGARPYVGALAYHLYARGWEEGIGPLRQLGEAYDLPVWMTEYSRNGYDTWPEALGWAETMHTVLSTGGVSAVDYLWGFFGSQDRAHTLVSMDFDDGRYERFGLTPAYYLTGQWSRFVRPGYVRVRAESTLDQVLTTAFTGPDGELVVAAVNVADGEQRVRLSFGGSELSGPVRAVRTSEGEDWADLEPITPEGPGLTVTLAPQSVTTFVAEVGSPG